MWEPGVLYNVKLSADQKFLMFEPHDSTPTTPTAPPFPDGDTDDAKSAANQATLPSVDLNKVIEIETHDSDKIGKKSAYF